MAEFVEDAVGVAPGGLGVGRVAGGVVGVAEAGQGGGLFVSFAGVAVDVDGSLVVPDGVGVVVEVMVCVAEAVVGAGLAEEVAVLAV